jgi:uncharacterized protein (TIGR02145 family)
MKSLISIFLSLLIIIFIGCSENNCNNMNGDTESPSVMVTYPPDNSELFSDSLIIIIAEADDNIGVDHVQFFLNGNNVYEDSEEPYEYSWNPAGSLGANSIYAKAYDESENFSTSDNVNVFILFTGDPPYIPVNPVPENYSDMLPLNLALSWNCGDINGDFLTYDLYFGWSNPPPLYASDLDTTYYELNDLEFSRTYYWQIEAKDQYNSTFGEIWNFQTLYNHTPDQPSDLLPENMARILPYDVTLSWQCSDHEGDSLTYEVYFGDTPNPQLIMQDLTETSFVTEYLDEHTTYYWKIRACDDYNCVDSEIRQFSTYGIIYDIDRNRYRTLIFDDQEWMVDNLKVTRYSNGDEIPNLTEAGDWANTDSGAYSAYDNNPYYGNLYGNLYNWFAVDDPRGLAPKGWHIPTDEEFMELEMYLEMSYDEAHDTGWRGPNQGSMLAGRAILWVDGDLEEDPEFGTSGFNLLPGGHRNAAGNDFNERHYYAYIWTASIVANQRAWNRYVSYNREQVCRFNDLVRVGHSVRCVRDIE